MVTTITVNSVISSCSWILYMAFQHGCWHKKNKYYCAL